MNREEILKFLQTLGIKVTVDGAEGTLKEADAIKLVEEQFKAANLGLVQKRDELLAEVVKYYKETITTKWRFTTFRQRRNVGRFYRPYKPLR